MRRQIAGPVLSRISARLLPAFLALASLGLAAGAGVPAAAQSGAWQPLGPAGGGVVSLAPLPRGAGAVWAGVGGVGVWRSLDSGASWVRSPLVAPVNVVVADPGDPLTVYAGTDDGLLKSGDGGQTWTLVHFEGPVSSLAVAPSAPAVVYEATGSGFNNLWRSGDGGVSWSHVALPGSHVGIRVLVVDPTDPNRVYLGGIVSTVDPVPVLLLSTDGGGSWQALPTAFPILSSLVVDSRRPLHLYAGTYDFQHPVSVSNDGGQTWQAAGAGLPVLQTDSLALDPASGALYVALQSFDPTGGQIWKSADGGATWSLSYQAPRAILGLAVDGGLPGRVYATLDGAGMAVSADAGGHWTVANVGLDGVAVTDVAADPHAPGTVYAALQAQSALGLAKSTDGGLTWAPASSGLDASFGDPPRVERILADPRTAGVLYAATEAGVSRSADGGATWQDAGGLQPRLIQVTDIELVPAAPALLVATGQSSSADRASAVLTSADGGASWNPIPANLGSDATGTARFDTVAYDPSVPAVIFVGGQDGLLKTADGGASWSSLTAAASATLPLVQQPIRRLRVDAAHMVYAVLSPGPHTLYRSAGGAGAWTALDGGLPAGSVRDLLIDAGSGALTVATDAGVYRSLDGGEHWTSLGQELSEPRVTRLAADPARPGVLYAATGAGLFVSPPPGGVCTPGDTTLCLADGRFAAQVSWTAPTVAGDGHAVPLGDVSGGFWFFSPGSTELLVKMVDGRAVNGRFWLFYGGLSDVAFTLTVTDAMTGTQHVYRNPAGRLASFADTGTFGGAAAHVTDETAGSGIGAIGSIGGGGGSDSTGAIGGAGGAAAGPLPPAAVALPDPAAAPVRPGAPLPAAGGGAAAGTGNPLCAPAGDTLCLAAGGRFQVQVEWRLSPGSGFPGLAVPLSADTGAFWFLGPQSLELMVKVLDGRAVNGHFWVFVAGLSDLGYEVTVTDLLAGSSKQYVNAPGALTSLADTGF